MRTSEATRYARWAAATAVVLALIAAGVYAWRQWQAAQSQKDAPPVVPQTVQRQSEEFSFSKVEGERTLFTVRASQLTELREGGKSLLEDVWITIYGRTGQRFDNIHASKCDYLPIEGTIGCAGDVQIDLESAAEARERPGQRTIRIRTSNISFDRETGRARTDQPVEFQFEFGHGRGTGMSYSTEEAAVRLERDVHTTLTSAAGGRPIREALALSAAAMEYRRDSRTMRLLGPVRAQQGLRELTAQAMALEFDAEMRARRLVANGANGDARPRLNWVEDNSERQLVADEFVARFASDGRVTQLTAQGNLSGTARGGGREDGLAAQMAVIEMDGRGEPRSLVARGEVRVESRAGARQQRLETEVMRLELAGRAAGRRSVSRGQTLAPAVVELREGDQVTRLRAAQLAGDFGPRNRLDKLMGTGGVEIVRRLAGGPEQRTTSQEFAVTFGGGGQWMEAEQTGEVRFREGERLAEAEKARIVRATDTLVMKGPATVADALTRTTAAKIEINQRTGEAVATGNVRTSYLQAGGAAVRTASGGTVREKSDTEAQRAQKAAEREAISNLKSQISKATPDSQFKIQEQGNQKQQNGGGASPAQTSGGRGPNFASEPAHIAADRLRVSGDAGRAVYSGRARLWQGDAVIESEEIELNRDGQRIEARGNVRGVFPEAALAAQRTELGATTKSDAEPQSSESRRGAGERAASVVRFTAGRLAYSGQEGRARLTESVTAESAQTRMTAPEVTLELADASQAQSGAPRSVAQDSRVARAVATGGCTVRQGTRRGTAQRCAYEAAEGKFVLSGGEPALFDPELGATTGRQLTFFLADDKILVESAEGTRTVTRHRVEK